MTTAKNDKANAASIAIRFALSLQMFIAPSVPSWRRTTTSDRGGDPLLELLLWLGADLARRQLTVLEQHQGRNRHDAVLGGNAWVLVDVELDDLHLAVERIGDFFQGRGNHPARTAPFRPEINDHGTARLEHVLVKRGIGYLLDHKIPRLFRRPSALD